MLMAGKPFGLHNDRVKDKDESIGVWGEAADIRLKVQSYNLPAETEEINKNSQTEQGPGRN
jgi:hypothetical protein